MVSDSLKKMFEERNIQVIPIGGGTRVFVDGFSSNGEHHPQVLVGSSMLVEGGGLDPELRTYRIARKLNLENNPFLEDHAIGGHPVLPAAFVMEWMADGCEPFYPGYRFSRCEDFKTLKGISLDEAPAAELWMDVTEIRKVESREVECEVRVSSHPRGGKLRHHYSARILLLAKLPEMRISASLDGNESEVIEGVSLYEDGTLFHGPRFQVVDRVIHLSDQRLTMKCSLPEIDEKEQGQFPVRDFNPYAADALFQAMLIWVRRQRDAGSLPSKVQRLEHSHPLLGSRPFYVSLEVKDNARAILTADVTAHDETGKVYMRMLGAEVTVSKTLKDQFRKATSQ
jgi:hypothetical protein